MTDNAARDPDLADEEGFEATRLDPADPATPGEPLTPFELRVYARAGLDPHAAQDWVRAGIEPYQAEAFRSAGVLELAEAEAWHGRGIGGVEYAQWITRGVEPDQILDHLQREQEATALQAAEFDREQRERAVEAEDLREVMEGQLLVTVGEIAELAEATSSSVVSHWRKGARKFPAPVTGGRSPQFTASDVITWMRQQGKLAEGRPDPEWYWCQAVRALPADTEAAGRPGLRAFVAALVTMSAALAGRLGSNVVVPKPADQLPADLAGARQLAFDLCQATPELRPVLLHGLERATPSDKAYLLLVQGLRLCSIAKTHTDDWQLLDKALAILLGLSRDAPLTGAGLAELMTGLFNGDSTGSVLDPACGEGELLAHMATHRQVLAGIDSDIGALGVANARFLLRPHHGSQGIGSVTIREGDALVDDPFDGQRFDAVLIDPPLDANAAGPAEWVDLALRRLTPEGRGVVLVRANALSKGGPLAPVFRRGRIGVVLLLPSGSRFAERRDLALCVLAGEDDHYEHVLVVDISDQKIDNGAPQPDLSRSSSAPRQSRNPTRQLTQAVRRWLEHPNIDGRIGKAVRTQVVSTTEAASGGIEHLPALTAPTRPDPEVLEAAETLQRLLASKRPNVEAPALEKALAVFLRGASPS